MKTGIRYWFVILFAVAMLWFAIQGRLDRNKTERMQQNIAAFIKSDARVRISAAKSQREFATFVDSLTIRTATCDDACLSEKWLLFTKHYYKFQRDSARRSEKIANFWRKLAADSFK